MHVVGAFGWGCHYEDAVTVLHPSLLVSQRDSGPTRLNTILLLRAEAYYKIIAEGRSVNPSRASEVLVRAFVTAVAQQSLAIAQTNPALFNDPLSLMYLARSDTATLGLPRVSRTHC